MTWGAAGRLDERPARTGVIHFAVMARHREARRSSVLMA